MKRRPISLCIVLSLAIMFFLPTSAFSITRDEIISAAETFEFHTWHATASNVFHGTAPDGLRLETPDENCSLPGKEPGWWSTTQQNTGIPYKWGGFDHPVSFDDGISEGKYAGAPRCFKWVA